MTEKDKELQDLRQELARVQQENRELKDQHFLDTSTIMNLRRMCGAMEERLYG